MMVVDVVETLCQEIPTDCESPRPLYLMNRRERRFLRLGCNSWRCKGCARHKGKTVQKRMLLMQPTHLLTFSLPRAAAAELAEVKTLHKGRRAFFDWLRRQPWGMEKQGWVLEAGEENGQLHVHCLVRMRARFLPYARTQEVARRLGLGTLDWQHCWRLETAARYVAKYIAKGLKDAGVALGRAARRFGMSNHLTLEKNPDWVLARKLDWQAFGIGLAPLWLFRDENGEWAEPAPAG